MSRAVGNAFTKHAGTLAFAGLVLWFVDALKKKAKRKTVSKNPICCLIVCCVKCVAMCILSYIEYLTKMAVIVTGKGQAVNQMGGVVWRGVAWCGVAAWCGGALLMLSASPHVALRPMARTCGEAGDTGLPAH